MASVPPSAAGALEGMATRATRAQRWVRSPSSGELELKASVGGRERAFQMRSVLVQDKHDTTIMLGILLEQDPEAPHAWRAVQGAPEVVLKVVRLGSHAGDQALNELWALSGLTHHEPSERVVHLMEAMQDDTHLYIITPYMAGGDLLERVLRLRSAIPPSEARRFFTHIVQGLQHLKGKDIAHGDVTLENIVLTPDSASSPASARLIDLGRCVSPAERVGYTPAPGVVYGKPGYIAPEAVVGAEEDDAPDPYAMDVWSLGVCLYTMLTGRPLYSDPSDPAFQALASGQAGALVDHYGRHEETARLCPKARSLIISLLAPTPTNRPALHEIMRDPWVAGDSTPELVAALAN